MQSAISVEDPDYPVRPDITRVDVSVCIHVYDVIFTALLHGLFSVPRMIPTQLTKEPILIT